MKKSEVNICDDCQRIIAKKKCEICDGDICEDCEDDLAIGLANGGVLFFIISCKKCAKKLECSKLKSYFENEPHTKIRNEIVGVFRNAIVVENLQENNNKVDKSWINDKIKEDENDFVSSFKTRGLGSWKKKTKAITTGLISTNAFKTMKGGK